MANLTFQNAKVAKAMEQVVPVKLNYLGTGKDLAKQHQVLWAPTFLTVRPDGTIVDRFLMNQPPDRFVTMLNEAFRAAQAPAKLEWDAKTSGAHLARMVRRAASLREMEKSLAAARELAERAYRGEDAARTYLAAAECALFLNKHKESVEMFELAAKVARTVDEKGYAYVYLGQLNGLLGKKAEAVRYSELVLKLKNVNPNYIKYAKEYLEFLKKGS